MCQPKDFAHLKIVNGSDIHSTQWKTYLEEEFDDWHRGYLPKNGRLDGKVVYDFGAGCGETAQLFLNHGARKVVCIECDPLAIEYLKINFSKDPRIQINPDEVGWIKMDIERAEKNTRFEFHDGAPGFEIFRKWDRTSNTGLYGLKISRLNTMIQEKSVGVLLHSARIRIAHRIKLMSDRLDEIIGEAPYQ